MGFGGQALPFDLVERCIAFYVKAHFTWAKVDFMRKVDFIILTH